MLSVINKTTNLTATSTIKDEIGDHVVMNMIATVSSEAGVNITQTIRNKELYRENEDAVNADFDAFRDAILKETEV